MTAKLYIWRIPEPEGETIVFAMAESRDQAMKTILENLNPSWYLDNDLKDQISRQDPESLDSPYAEAVYTRK